MQVPSIRASLQKCKPPHAVHLTMHIPRVTVGRLGSKGQTPQNSPCLTRQPQTEDASDFFSLDPGPYKCWQAQSLSRAPLSGTKELLPKLTWAGRGKGGASKPKEAFLN